MEKSLAEQRLERQKAKISQELQDEQAKNATRGKVVSSYYTAEDMRKLLLIGEFEGVALGGIQHEAVLQYVDHYDWQKIKAKEEAQSAKELTKVLKIVEKEAVNANVNAPSIVLPKDVYDKI